MNDVKKKRYYHRKEVILYDYILITRLLIFGSIVYCIWVDLYTKFYTIKF